MKRMLKRLAAKASEHKNKIVAAGTVALGTAQAQAALTAPVIDTGDFIAVAGSVLVVSGVMFGIKKAIGLVK